MWGVSELRHSGAARRGSADHDSAITGSAVHRASFQVVAQLCGSAQNTQHPWYRSFPELRRSDCKSLRIEGRRLLRPHDRARCFALRRLLAGRGELTQHVVGGLSPFFAMVAYHVRPVRVDGETVRLMRATYAACHQLFNRSPAKLIRWRKRRALDVCADRENCEL